MTPCDVLLHQDDMFSMMIVALRWLPRRSTVHYGGSHRDIEF